MPEISVIVPAYNAEKYIETCLNSLLKQSYYNYEIVVVNDGSRDDTLKILKKYEGNYPNKIKLINQQNKGLSGARNTGIKYSTGKYLMFVDSDDYIEEKSLEIMYKKMISDNFDIVVGGVNIVYPDKILKRNAGISEDIKRRDDIAVAYNTLYMIACNKLYKKELFSQVKFKEGIWFEDVNFLYKLLPYIKSIGFVDYYYYNYIQRENSITYTYNDKLYQAITNFDDVIEYYKENNFYDEYKDVIEYAYIRYSLATFIKRLAKSKDKNKFRQGLEFAIKNLKEKYPDYKNNYYLNQKGIKNLYLKYFNKFIAYIIFYKEKNKMN